MPNRRHLVEIAVDQRHGGRLVRDDGRQHVAAPGRRQVDGIAEGPCMLERQGRSEEDDVHAACSVSSADARRPGT